MAKYRWDDLLMVLLLTAGAFVLLFCLDGNQWLANFLFSVFISKLTHKKNKYKIMIK